MDDLRQWALNHNVPHNAVGDLLKILHVHHPELPIDSRTLLNTNRTVHPVSTAGGEFYYFGISEFISQIKEYPVEISANIDGVPLYSSNNQQFWPILCTFNDSLPVTVAIFSGVHKPHIDSFFSDFVKEILKFSDQVKVVSFVCDSPARAFIKCVKSPNGYSSCDKCTVHGDYNGHVYFDDSSAPLRTDENFRSESDKDHHKGASPLLKLPIDMVKAFPYDYMHLVCLGVMRRLIFFWSQGPLKTRFSQGMLKRI